MKLFIAHFLLVEETSRAEVHYVTSSLFSAENAESAYVTAQSWVSAHDDSTHNASGELVRYYSSGLYELEEVCMEPSRLLAATREPYGVDVGHIRLTSAGERPAPRPKAELAVFVSSAAQQVLQADAAAQRGLS